MKRFLAAGAGALLLVTALALPAFAGISVEILDSTLNGQSGTTITVGPGRMIRGTVRAATNSTRMFREHTGIYYNTWDDGHLYFARDIYGPAGTLDVEIEMEAPGAEGTYYIVFFFDAANPQGTWSNASSTDPRIHFDRGRAVKVIVEEGAGGGSHLSEIAAGIEDAEELRLGRTASGRVDYSGNQEDWYKIEVDDPGVLEASLTISASKKLTMTLYNEGKNVVAEDSDNRSYALRVDSPGNRTYYLRVAAAGSGDRSDYRLRTDLSGFDGIDQDDRVEGNVNFLVNRDDTFFMEALQNGRQRIELQVAERNADLDLYVFDDDWELIAKSENQSGDESLDFDAFAGHDYFVRVRAYNLWAVSDYVLITSLSEAPAGSGMGWDDAVRIEAGNRKTGNVNGRFENTAVDWYYIEIAENGRLNLHLDWIRSGQDVDLQLYDRNGRLLAKSDNSAGSDEIIEEYVEAGERYYIKIYAYSGEDNSNYRLTVSFMEEERGVSEGGTIEGGSSRGSAAEIQLNRAYRDAVDYAGDVNDWYFVRADRDGDLTVRVELDRRAARLNFALYSAGGGLLAVVPAYEDVMALTVEARRNEKIYIWVAAAGWNQASDFTLSAFPGSGSGSSSGSGASVFNEGRRVATQIQPGSTEYRDSLTSGSDDDDWWYVQPSQNGTLLVWVAAEGGEKNIDMEVYDESGQVVARAGSERGNEAVVVPGALRNQKYYIRLVLKESGFQRYVLRVLRV